MPAAAEIYSLGAPVEIGSIEKELKKLWQGREGAMTRASLMNLAVYSEEAGSLNKNTQLMAQMALVETAHREAKQRLVLCDLNWTRVDHVRFALAQFFDHPASHHRLAKISKVRIDFAPAFRSTAFLFTGWLGAQLDWQPEKTSSPDKLRFTGRAGRTVEVELREREGQPIHEIALTAGDAEFLVTHAECGDLLEVSRGKPGENPIPQLMPAGKHDSVNLMSEELMRGGPHHVYLRAVNCVRDLL